MSEEFTENELITAGTRLGKRDGVKKTLAVLSVGQSSPYTAEMIAHAACVAGWKISMKAVVDEARRLREELKPAINASMTITAGELDKWAERFRREHSDVTEVILEGHFAREIIEDILAHREPDYPEGTVVEDADGIRWKRSKYGWTQGAYIWGPNVRDDSRPARPLKVIP